MSDILALIPSRYGSSRFPGKPLALIQGVPMIVRVYRQAAKVFDNVCVATDDERILQCVKNYGGEAVMTSSSHNSGTDRCLEALERYSAIIGKIFEVIINVQGDEPFVSPVQLQRVADCFADPQVQIATVVKRCLSVQEANDHNRPKVVVDNNMDALYFSRSLVPFHRDGKLDEAALQQNKYYLHVGLYGYRAETLNKICAMPQSYLELTEKLEQLRWLENGLKIRVAESFEESWPVDTPQDLERLNQMLIKDK